MIHQSTGPYSHWQARLRDSHTDAPAATTTQALLHFYITLAALYFTQPYLLIRFSLPSSVSNMQRQQNLNPQMYAVPSSC